MNRRATRSPPAPRRPTEDSSRRPRDEPFQAIPDLPGQGIATLAVTLSMTFVWKSPMTVPGASPVDLFPGYPSRHQKRRAGPRHTRKFGLPIP